MPAGLARTVQASFAGGMYRAGAPELIPAEGVYDAQNCIIDRLGGLAKRGGTSYRSSEGFHSGLRWIWDGTLAVGGQQTLVADIAQYGRLKGEGEGFTNLEHGGATTAIKPAVYQGRLFFPGGNTFDGTTWGTAAKVGSQYTVVANRLVTAVGRQVWVSELKTPMPNPPAFAENEYIEVPEGVTILALESGRDSCVIFTTNGVWVLSNLAMKLTDAAGNVQWKLDHFSSDLILWGVGGIAGWEGNLIVPGTDALWLINRGVTSEVPRSFARLSDPIRELYREYVKQGYEPGQATVYENHYLLPIIDPSAGPPTKLVDLLVCRLDLPAPRGGSLGAWTRFAGKGAALGALTVRVSTGATREPELIGAELDGAWSGPGGKGSGGHSPRVVNLHYFDPAASTQDENHEGEATFETPVWAVETRAFPTGQAIPNLVARLRVRYLMYSDVEADPPLMAAQIAGESAPSSGDVWGGFIWGSGEWATPTEAGGYTTLPGEAPASYDALKAYSWRLHRKVRFVRFRLSVPQIVKKLDLRQLELFVRQAGRP